MNPPLRRKPISGKPHIYCVRPREPSVFNSYASRNDQFVWRVKSGRETVLPCRSLKSAMSTAKRIFERGGKK